VTSIDFVYHICAFLPAIGLLAAFLPETAKPKVPGKRGKRMGQVAARPHSQR